MQLKNLQREIYNIQNKQNVLGKNKLEHEWTKQLTQVVRKRNKANQKSGNQRN